MGLFPNSTVLMQRAEYRWINSPNGPNDNVNQLMALARKPLGTPKNLQLIDGDMDVFSRERHLGFHARTYAGHQSLLVHLKKSGFIITFPAMSFIWKNLKNDIMLVSLDTGKSKCFIASMEKIRSLIATYHAALFINHDKKQTDQLKLLPAFYD